MNLLSHNIRYVLLLLLWYYLFAAFNQTGFSTFYCNSTKVFLLIDNVSKNNSFKVLNPEHVRELNAFPQSSD